MTELEIMKHAKRYMDKLSQGIDPLTDETMPEDTVLNNVRLARCFSYVSGILQQVIDNGGTVTAPNSRNRYKLSPGLAERLSPADRPLRISDFCALIGAASEDPEAKRPTTMTITDWLIKNGYMERIQNAEGKSQRVPTENGNKIGICTEAVQGQYGEYLNVFYSPDAQRFLIDHLEEIFR